MRLDGAVKTGDRNDAYPICRPACWIDLFLAGDAISIAKPSIPVPDYAVGSRLTLGLCEQDANTANGAEPVEWTIIHRENNRALLLSTDALWAMRYSKSKSCTWDESAIREWINGTFLPQAFTVQEATAFAQRTVRAETGHAGAHTEDKVFLLSRTEVETYLPDPADRIASATPFALTQDPEYASKKGEICWWLRSSKSSNDYADTVRYDGDFGVNEIGRSANLAIRPAIWVNLDAEGLARTVEP